MAYCLPEHMDNFIYFFICPDIIFYWAKVLCKLFTYYLFQAMNWSYGLCLAINQEAFYDYAANFNINIYSNNKETTSSFSIKLCTVKSTNIQQALQIQWSKVWCVLSKKWGCGQSGGGSAYLQVSKKLLEVGHGTRASWAGGGFSKRVWQTRGWKGHRALKLGSTNCHTMGSSRLVRRVRYLCLHVHKTYEWWRIFVFCGTPHTT